MRGSDERDSAQWRGHKHRTERRPLVGLPTLRRGGVDPCSFEEAVVSSVDLAPLRPRDSRATDGDADPFSFT